MTDIPLAESEELLGFKGAPFTPVVIQGAAESIRDDCGWHIAPEITETLKVRGGGTVLLLPTLHLVSIASIKTSAGADVLGFDFFDNGVVERLRGFPRVVEVTFTHGYSKCPPALLGVVAERASTGSYGRVRQESLGSRSVSLESGYDSVGAGTVQKYALPRRP